MLLYNSRTIHRKKLSCWKISCRVTHANSDTLMISNFFVLVPRPVVKKDISYCTIPGPFTEDSYHADKLLRSY